MMTIDLFDLGIVEMLGGKLTEYREGGETRLEYAVPHPTVLGNKLYGGKIPIFFAGGNQQFMSKVCPYIVINRTGIDKDDGRRVGWNLEYAKPSKFARDLITTDAFGNVYTGKSQYELKTRTMPYDIAYEITAVSRGGMAKTEAQTLFMYLLSIFTPDGFSLTVRNEDDIRTYDGSTEDIQTDTNYLDLTMREIKYGLTIKIKGEIDFAIGYDVMSVGGLPVGTFSQS